VAANAEEPQQHAPLWGTGPPAGGWQPIPDPTKLTTEQLRRELATLREILETRLHGMDRATKLANAQTGVIREQITQTGCARKRRPQSGSSANYWRRGSRR
jgi:hypothetical protein